MKKLSAFFIYLLVVILLTSLVSCKDEIATSSNGGLGQINDHSSNGESSTDNTSKLTGTDSVPTEVSDEISDVESESSAESQQNTISKSDDNSKNTVSKVSETSKTPGPTKTIVGLQANYKGYNLKLGSKINKSDIAASLKYNDGSTTNTSDFTFTPATVTKEGENKIKVTFGKYETEVIVRGIIETEKNKLTDFKVTYSGGIIKDGDIIDYTKVRATATYSDNTIIDVTDEILYNDYLPQEGVMVVCYGDHSTLFNIPYESFTKQKLQYMGHEYYLRSDGKAVLTNFSSQDTDNCTFPVEINGHMVAEIGTGFEIRSKKVTIPATIDRIPATAKFLTSQSCQEIVVDSKNPNYCSVDGVLYNKDKTILIRYPVGKNGKSFVIPNTVVEIADSAFSFCRELTDVTIPDSVKIVGARAFQYYNWDKTCIIRGGKNIEIIGRNAFFASGITEFTLGNKVKEIGSSAFSQSRIKSITIPDNVKRIEFGVFHSCYQLETVTLGKQIAYIGVCAFNSCKSLKNINFSSTLKKIDVKAFEFCPSLTNISLPASVVFIGEGAFKACSSLQSINIPIGAEVGERAFEGCKNLTTQ